MRRRAVLAGGGALATTGAARAQRPARPFRIGYLGAGGPGETAFALFGAGLGRIGWVEGRDYVLRTRFANSDTSRLPALLDPLLGEGIDVLVAIGAATRVVPVAERAVPVVFSFSGDPVVAGYVRSLARPGGNATGNSQLMWELVGKRLELLREIAPDARRTLVVQSPDHPGETEERSRTQGAGAQLGLELMVRPVRDRAALEAALAEGEAARCDSMLCFNDSVTLPNRHLIADQARRMRVPSVFPRRDFCEVGGLASFGPNYPALVARLAVFVERIAGGARAGDIPVEWPTVIETVANKRTADAIGRALPAIVLARADEVIE
ncbi:MAG: ABC transporter substrate-binding protein [Rhodospirillales bacterium]|nr:MAG: ABC transporter substrate-binding protein [Rhodospirillales bacterium]